MNLSQHNKNPLHLSALVDPVMTSEAVHERAQHIEQALELLFETQGSTVKKLKAALSYDEYHHLKAYSETYRLNLNNASEVQRVLRALKEYITRLPTIKLVIAYTPRQAFVEEITHWLTTHVPTPLLLEITPDPCIVGGAVVSFRGKQYDFSLNRKLNEHMRESDDDSSTR